MWLFKSKQQREVEKNLKRKAVIVNKIEVLLEDIYQNRIIDAKVKLDSIKNKLEDQRVLLGKEQLNNIEECLKSIETHMDKSYSDYIIGRCDKIFEIIRGKSVANTREEKAFESNSETIADLEAKIANYESQKKKKADQIFELEQKIDGLKVRQQEAQDIDDKVTWKKYFYEIKNYEPKVQHLRKELEKIDNLSKIAQHSLNAYHQQNINIESSNAIKESSDLATQLEQQSDIVDVDVAEERVRYANEQATNVNAVADKLNDLIGSNYGTNSDGLGDDEAEIAWQRACEQAKLDELNQNNNNSKDTSKRK